MIPIGVGSLRIICLNAAMSETALLRPATLAIRPAIARRRAALCALRLLPLLP